MVELETLEEAKHFLKENIKDGAACPCCKQLVKLYKRKLTSGMAIAIINLYKESVYSSKEYVHITELGHLNGGEFAQLKRWGMIREQENEDTAKRTSGMWAITAKGKSFVLGMYSPPKYVYTYNMATIQFSNQVTNIKQALGNKFNYKELMNS